MAKQDRKFRQERYLDEYQSINPTKACNIKVQQNIIEFDSIRVQIDNFFALMYSDMRFTFALLRSGLM